MQEAKLEIPFLHHPYSPDSSTLVGFKAMMLFSSWMMSIASKAFPGLRTTKATFTASKAPGVGNKYETAGWLQVEDVEGGETKGEGWGVEDVRGEITSWWAGSGTGSTAFKVSHAGHLAHSMSRRRDALSYERRELTRAWISQHNMSPLTPPSPRRLKLRLHLPSFVQLSQVDLLTVEPSLVLDNDGWWETEVNGWWLSEQTRMEAIAAQSL